MKSDSPWTEAYWTGRDSYNDKRMAGLGRASPRAEMHNNNSSTDHVLNSKCKPLNTHETSFSICILLCAIRPKALQITATSKQRHQQQLFTQAQHKCISLDTLTAFLYSRNLHFITKDLVIRDSCSKHWSKQILHLRTQHKNQHIN